MIHPPGRFADVLRKRLAQSVAAIGCHGAQIGTAPPVRAPFHTLVSLRENQPQCSESRRDQQSTLPYSIVIDIMSANNQAGQTGRHSWRELKR